MKVGIVVYSKTGNTLSVCEKIKKAYESKGHYVQLLKLEPVNEDPRNPTKVELKDIPEIGTYDILIFGSPVHAFSLAPAMENYLTKAYSLEGKKIGCFVTQQLPFAWMGGNRAISQIKKGCKNKGANVLKSGIINWSHKGRNEKIDSLVKDLSEL